MAKENESMVEWLEILTKPKDEVEPEDTVEVDTGITDVLPDIDGEDVEDIYYKHYGKPPSIEWSFSKTRQATIEKRITRLVKKFKPFYLVVINSDDTVEEWFVDSGNWVAQKQEDNKYRGVVGHIKNLLPFLSGKNPIGQKNK